MSSDDEYNVELTFREWMDICHALGYAGSGYRAKDMDGQANKFDAINERIAEELKDNE
jgi:hypothetical protein